MRIKTISLIFLLLVTFTGSNCKKKISKYPFEMAGVWVASDFFCGLVLIIEKDNTGKMFNYDGGSCVGGDANLKGKIKYKKDVLYVANKKYKMFNEPALNSTNDSIDAPDENDFTNGKTIRRRILAKMTLQQMGFLSFHETYNFYKYIDY